MNHIRPVLGVIHLGVELNAVKTPLFVADGNRGAGVGMGGQREALGHLFHIVAVAHPSDALLRKALEELAVRVEIGFGLAVFPGGVLRPGGDLAAQMVGQQLAAVANAKNRNPQFKNGGVYLRRGGIIHAVWPTGKDNADGRFRLQLVQRGGIGLNFAVHIALADAAGDELIVLSAKVQYDDFLHISRPPGKQYCPARRIR